MIRTTRLASFDIDPTALKSDFQLFSFPVPKGALPVASAITMAAAPAALLSHRGSLFAAIPSARAELAGVIPSLPATPVQFRALDRDQLSRLALRLACANSCAPDAALASTSPTAWGIYRAGTPRKTRGGLLLSAVELDLERHDNSEFLNLRSRLFYDREALAPGEVVPRGRRAQAERLLRYQRAANGALVFTPVCEPGAEDRGWHLKSRHMERAASEFVDLRAVAAGDTEAFAACRTGALHWLFDQVLPGNPYFCCELERLAGSAVLVDLKAINAQYTAIDRVLGARPVTVHDATNDSLDRHALELLGARRLAANSVPVTAGPDLVIVDEPDAYAAAGRPDPYPTLKQAWPYCQAITRQQLPDPADGTTPAWEVCLKEIAIKRELDAGQFAILAPPPAGLDFYAFAGPPAERRWARLGTELNGRFTVALASAEELLEACDYQFTLPQDSTRTHYIVRRADRAAWEIRKSPAAALVEFERLAALCDSTGQAQLATITPAELAATLARLDPANRVKAASALGALVTADRPLPCQLVTSTLSGRNSAFYAALKAVTGLEPKPSLKGKAAITELLGGAVGIWKSADLSTYFAGATLPLNTLSRACELYQVSGTAPAEPWLFELLEVYFIRHRDTTVLPYPFKYLREFLATAAASDTPRSATAA